MGYFDNIYDEYEDVIFNTYEEHEEPIDILGNGFSKETIGELLYEAGLTFDKSVVFHGNMEKLIFLHGNEQEIYSREEIEFIENVKNVILYPNFFRLINNEKMVCRTFAVKLDSKDNSVINDCVSFEKIINKAFDGFNLFMFLTEESVFFGCKIFNRGDSFDCALSLPISTQGELEQMLDSFTMRPEYNDFMRFYNEMFGIIVAGEAVPYAYEDLVIKRRGVQLEYINEIDDISKSIGIDLSSVKQRYIEAFEIKDEPEFISVLEDVEESLAFIKSNRVNTYELLFEAEETARMAEVAEKERTELIEQLQSENVENNTNLEILEHVMLNDPEEAIKLLKKMRGI